MDASTTVKPDLCIIGLDAAGFEIALGAAGLGVPVLLVTQRAPGDAERIMLRRLAAFGVRVVEDAGRFLDRRRFRAGDLLIRARRYVIATGTMPLVPPLPGLADVPAWRGEGSGVLVPGGDGAAAAAAQRARRSGAQVLMAMPGRFLPDFDPEPAAILATHLRREGIVLAENTDITALRITPRADGTFLLEGAGPAAFAFSHASSAWGEAPCLDALDPVAAGIGLDAGRLRLSAALRTRNRRIYAAGAVTMRPGGARLASAHAGIVLGETLFRRAAPLEPALETRLVETVPALAQVGLRREAAAPGAAGKLRFHRAPLAQTGRVGAAGGLIKITTAKDGTVRGAAILAEDAAELIPFATLAIARAMPLTALAAVPIARPAHAEAFAVLGRQALAERAASPFSRWLVRFLRLFG